MPWLFISHSSEDDAMARDVLELLQEERYDALFLDFDPARGIAPGRRWEEELWSELRRADAVVFLASAAASASRWCFAELALARSMGLPIIPIAIGDGARHDLVADVQWIDWTAPRDDVRARLRRGLGALGADGSPAWARNRSPYPGLRSFDADDAAVFYGRDEEVKALERRLNPTLERGSRRLTLLVGPSGGGKSSVVKAGLIPRLRSRGGWAVAEPMTPGESPLEALARALTPLLGARLDWKATEQRLRAEPHALAELAGEVLDARATGTRLLLFIDQAEELASLAAPAERAAFADLLRGALAGERRLWALATLRSEFLDAVLIGIGLGEVAAEPQLLLPLARSRLFAVVQQPSKRAGVELDPGLVAQLVDDTVGGDALPLLAYTLERLWDRCVVERGQRRIGSDDYAAIEGVVGALQEQADDIADELRRAGLGDDVVLPALMRLVTVDGEGEPTRRRIALESLPPDEEVVVRAFAERRLLTVGRSTVEVAHEALLRNWAPLRSAIDTARSDLRTRSELERLAADWVRAGRRDSYLLRGERLETALAWASNHESQLAQMPQLRDFVARGWDAERAAPAPDDRHYEQVWRFLMESSLVVVLGQTGGAASVRDALAAEVPPLATGALRQVSEVAQMVALRRGRAYLTRRLRRLAEESEPGPVHRFLARCGTGADARRRFPLVLTTGFDFALERAFDEERRPYDLVVHAGQGRFVHVPPAETAIPIDVSNDYAGLPIDEHGDLERPLIVKLFGGVAGDRSLPGSVITTDDFDDYQGRAPLDAVLPGRLLDRLGQSHCLFVGHDAGDRGLRAALRLIWADDALPARSWAISPGADRADQGFWARYDVALHALDLGDYVERLESAERHVQALDETSAPRAVAPTPASADPGAVDALDLDWLEENIEVVLVGSYLGGATVDDVAAALAGRFGVEGGTLPDVAQRVSDEVGRADLARTLGRVLAANSRPGPVHRLLARWNRPAPARRTLLVATTNVDTALERAFDREGVPYDLVVYVADGSRAGRFVHRPFDGEPVRVDEPNAYTGLPVDSFGDLERAVIFKVFGSLEGRDGFVVTRDELDTYLSGAPIERFLPFQLLSKLRDSCCLFIGHAGGERGIGVVLNRFWGGSWFDTQSFAVEPGTAPDRRYFWRRIRVESLPIDPVTFASALERHIAPGP